MEIFSDFLRVAETISNIKKQEVPIPIARKTGIVGPLTVGDDLALRTSIVSPVNYDREISKLLHSHTEFVLSQGETPTKETFEQFCATTSNIDKICLIWALYKTTYDTLGMRDFVCEKENCKTKFKNDVPLDDLIQEDSFIPWNEEIPFHDYIYPIDIDYVDYVYRFESRLPSMKEHNKLLSNISIDTLQNNMTQTGSIFAKKEQIALLTKSISICKKGESSGVRTENMQEMLIAFQSYIPQTVSDDFFKKYNEKFDRYYPKFYTNIKCPQCDSIQEYKVDLEVEFFRRSVFDRG